MKRMSFVLGLAAVALSATLRASVTLTSLTGSPNVPGTATFAVDAVSSARHDAAGEVGVDYGKDKGQRTEDKGGNRHPLSFVLRLTS